MKKYTFLLIPLMVLLSFSYKLVPKSHSNSSKKSTVKESSLNNIDSATALAMINKFQSLHSSDKTPQVASYFIPKAMLHAMVTLLKNENQGKTGVGSTDGIRIYFAYDLAVNLGSLTTKIIIVSTKDNGVFSGSTRRHKDYYSHPSNDPLFSLNGYEVTSLGNSTSSVPGALLFQTCTHCTDSPNCLPSKHSISRNNAEIMVHNFYLHPHSIQTNAEWFDLTLLNYLDNDNTSNGLRIYLGSSNTSNSWILPSTTITDRFILTDTMLDPSSKASIDNFSCSGGITTLTNTSGSGGSVSGTPPQDDGELCPQNCG